MSAIPEQIKSAAAALRELVNIDQLLRFPEAYIASDESRLSPIVEYTPNAFMPWDPEWGHDLRKAGIREIARVVIKALSEKRALMVADHVAPENRDLVGQKLILYDAICAVEYGRPFKTLLADTGLGDEQALLDLVRLDKSFVTMPWCRGLILRKQHEADWAFFKKLGTAIGKPPFSGTPGMYGAILLTAAFWDERYRDLSYAKTVVELEKLGLVSGHLVDAKYFSQRIRRAGLSKDRHSRY